MTYDADNIFAKILRGEIPCNKVYEDDHVMAFHDIAPSAPVHVLVIPRSAHRSFEHFISEAGLEMVGHYFESVQKVVRQLGLCDFRIITNNGASAGQSVFHFHVHILAGREMGALLAD